MQRYRYHSRRKGEQGLIITLVAVFMSFVVVVMAALAIDITTLYTARSEAQLAADGAALAGARALANSGLTSSAGLSPSFPVSTAETLAQTVAFQVAESNEIGGKQLTSTNIKVSFNDNANNFTTNPHVTVQVTRNDLPVFFLRFWSKQLTVSASATAEAYNPSGSGPGIPVAPLCVKPWLLPDYDPTRPPPQKQIFDIATGEFVAPSLIGRGWPTWSLSSETSFTGAPIPGQYYPAIVGPAAEEIPVPTTALPACSAGFTDYQMAVAACVSTPIQCGSGQRIKVDKNAYTGSTDSRDGDTVVAADCLIHSTRQQLGDADSIDAQAMPPPPFEFLAGQKNPVVGAQGKDILVSDSLVTIPVYNSANLTRAPGNTVTIIGFLQVFLNPYSAVLPNPSTSPPPYSIPVTIINEVGCGTDATGTPIYGNGPSTVPVRLITPP